MTRKRQGAGSVATAWVCSIFANTACTHGRQAAKRSAIDESVIDSYSSVKSAAVSRSDLSTPQYKKTTRKSCWGVLTFFARTKALNSRAIVVVSGGRSCNRSSKRVSGSRGGICMVDSLWYEETMAPCSMPLISIPYTLSWRRWGVPPAPLWQVARLEVPVKRATLLVYARLLAALGQAFLHT